jgi:hypothetical protein
MKTIILYNYKEEYTIPKLILENYIKGDVNGQIEGYFSVENVSKEEFDRKIAKRKKDARNKVHDIRETNTTKKTPNNQNQPHI